MTTRYYDYIVAKISSAKTKADSLAKNIEHHGLEGQIRELALKECIEPFLTHSYLAGSGKIVDIFESLTSQLDLIIYQTKAAPPILISKELGIFPVECCKYAFEVKSKLTATEIKESLKKFKSITQLTSYPKHQSDGNVKGGELPVTVLFAFDSDVDGIEIDRFLKYESGSSPSCSVLCVLGKGYWFFQNGAWHGEQSSQEKPFDEFCRFITGFMNTLASEETKMKGFKPGGYVNVDDFMLKAVHQNLNISEASGRLTLE